MKKAIQIAYNDMFELKCQLASRAGFKYISINYTEILDKDEYEWDKITDNIALILDKTNLKCVQSHPYYYDLRISSEIIDTRCEFAMHQAIKSSGKLGAQWCVFHPRSSINGGFRRSVSFEDNKRAFSSYLETAVRYGTAIAAENLPIFIDVVPVMPFYSSDYEDLCNFIDSFNDEKMAICWDTGHANLMNFDQAEAIRFLGKKIKCTHIHNNYGNIDNHHTPDSGNIKWNDVMSAFASICYDGPLTLETNCCYTEPVLFESFAKHNFVCLEYLEELKSRCEL